MEVGTNVALDSYMKAEVNMKLAMISQQCEYFKIESGKLGASWTEWSFETYYSEQQVYNRINTIPVGNIVKVYGLDILNNNWIKLLHKPVIKRIK